MLKVAMLSKWHVHAAGYANMLKDTGKVEITAVWDDDIARGEAWAKELGADFEPDLDKLLARDDVEAVACDAPTTAHHDILIKAAADENGEYTVPIRAMVCSCGKNNGTITGTFGIYFKHEWHPLFDNVYGQYVSGISGDDLF